MKIRDNYGIVDKLKDNPGLIGDVDISSLIKSRITEASLLFISLCTILRVLPYHFILILIFVMCNLTVSFYVRMNIHYATLKQGRIQQLTTHVKDT